MTEPVVCNKGKCGYKDKTLNEDWKNECVDCSLEEEIEHDVSIKPSRRQKG